MAEFLGVEYEGIPFGPAAGTINGTNKEQILEHIRDLAKSPAGIISMGSIGSRYNSGNSGETYFHDPETGETVNSLGLPEIGIDEAEEVIKEASRICEGANKALVVSVTSMAGEKAAEVLPELVERVAEAGGPRVRAEANYSCPNVVTAGGGRKPIVAYDLEATLETRLAIVDRMGSDYVFSEKLSPYVGEYYVMISDITGLYLPERRYGSVAVTGFNTVPGQDLKRNGRSVLRIVATVGGKEVITHAGGLSGPAMADQMYELQQEFVGRLSDDVPFIATNGVYDGSEVLRRTSGDNKAIAALGVTRFWEGEKVGRSFGTTATLVAQEYQDAIEAA